MKELEIKEKVGQKFPGSVIEFDDSVPQPYMVIDAAQFYKVAQTLRDLDEFDFDYLTCVSGVDYGEDLGTVYHLISLKHRHKIVLKVMTKRDNPVISSVADLWRTADWHEREIFDLFGIKFENHPDLKRILLPDEWEGHPLRKDYKTPEFFNGMRIWHPDVKGEPYGNK